MNMSKEQVQVALAAGLALTSPDSDLLDTFRKHGPGILILHQLLLAIGSGQVALSSPEGEAPPAAKGKPSATAVKNALRKKKVPTKKKAPRKKK